MTWLISSMGTSPSVLTEALWYLETQKGLTVDKLTCVGTQSSKAEAEVRLLAPGGALDRLRVHLGKPAHWLSERGGIIWELEPLQTRDNRDLEEARAMDRAFRRAIRTAQEDPDHDGEVIACISGGRKTMSSSLQQAMALLARNEDWAFHVLLNLPEGIQETEVIRSDFGFPGDPNHPAFLEVGVDAFEVPLVRLREYAAAKKIDLSDDTLVEKLQRAVDDARVLPRLTLNLRTLQLRDALSPGVDLHLPPQQALLMAGYARAGKPMTIGDAEPHLRMIIHLWKTLEVKEGTVEFPPEFTVLEDAIRWWVGESESKLLAPQKSKLKKLLLQADPAYRIFCLRARLGLEGNKQAGLMGFDDLVYRDPDCLKVTL